MKSLPVRRDQFKTADFAAWLAKYGAEIGTPTNGYEVIRYRAYHGQSRRAETHIVYAKESGLLTFCGASKEHYVQFLAGGQMYPSPADNPFIAPRRKVKDPDVPSSAEKRRQKLIARDGDECWFCGRAMGDDCTIEHLVPKSDGGRNSLSNYALAHRACNNAAANLPLVQKIEMRTRLRACDSGSDPEGENSRSEVEGGASQSGRSEAEASPK